jgi:7,8-dihydropterin-6-yl-methyl-4-(beta-D-ribofuranosyl)aminobenzene 5'-phosphate synthase
VRPDTVPDDQAVFFDTREGIVVLLGCAHAGVISTLDAVRELRPDVPVRAVVGGMHLRSAGRGRLEWTVDELKHRNIGMLAPMHCTGQVAAMVLWSAFPRACRVCGSGTTFEF